MNGRTTTLERAWTSALLAGCLMLNAADLNAQSTVFLETMGNVSATTAIATHDANGGFDNSTAFAFSGAGDIRSTTPSGVYAGASAGANAFLTNNGVSSFVIEGINTTGYADLVLSFGATKSTVASDMTDLVVEYSTDGTSFAPLTFPAQPTGTGTAVWRLVTITGGTIPASVNLTLRWRNIGSGTGFAQFRIDDVKLEGDPVSVVFDCPALNANIGDACSDGDPTTVNDVVGADCTCTGTALPDIRISQVYGGGGNSGSIYTNDFIELYNRTNAPVSLNGWSVQYASAAGSTWSVTLLNGAIPAYGYYLVQQAQGAGGTTPLPTPDATGTTAMASTNGKVALVFGTAALSGTCPTANVVDFVGFGSTANCFEGTGPTPTLSNTLAALRLEAGCVDTNDNAGDFNAGAPSPRNSSSPINTCNDDCAGVPGGSAVLDACGACIGGTTGVNPIDASASVGNIDCTAGTYGVIVLVTETGGPLSGVLIQWFIEGVLTAEASGTNFSSYDDIPAGSVASVVVSNTATGVCALDLGEFTHTCCDPAFAADAGQDAVVYFGAYAGQSCTTLAASASGGAPPYTFQWTGGPADANGSVCPQEDTVYTLTVTDANGCTTTDEVTVFAVNTACGNNDGKVLVCIGTPSGNYTQACINPNAVEALLNGNPNAFLGPCPKSAGRPGDGFRLFPNPGNGTLLMLGMDHVPGDVERIGVELSDLSGKRLHSQVFATQGGTFLSQVDLPGTLAPGVYLVQLSIGDGLITERLVVTDR